MKLSISPSKLKSAAKRMREKLYKTSVVRNGKRKKKWKTDREGYKVVYKNGIPTEVKVSSLETIHRKLGQKTGVLKRSGKKSASNLKRSVSNSLRNLTGLERDSTPAKSPVKTKSASKKNPDLDLDDVRRSMLQLDETMYRKKMIRDGKLVTKWMTVNPAYRIQYDSSKHPREVRITAAERRNRKYGSVDSREPGTAGQITGKMKRKAKRAQILRKWRLSMKKRVLLGLDHIPKFPEP